MSIESPVLYSVTDGVATITLNRPSALNAMTNALMAGIRQAVEQVEADANVRTIVLTGAGRAFCAGADLVQVAAGPDTDQPNGDDYHQEANSPTSGEDIFNDAMRALLNAPVPTIARINGPAAGGGFGLALACDITVAAHSAFFVATFGPNLGIVPDMGATWSIPRRVGRARALGITLLGDRIGAQQAQEWGLVWSAVPDADLDSEVLRIAQTLKRSSPSAVTRIRSTIDRALQNDFSDQLDLEMAHQAVLIPRNMRDGAKAFLEKRTPSFSGNRD